MTPLPDRLQPERGEHLNFLGPFIEAGELKEIAQGRLQPITRQPYLSGLHLVHGPLPLQQDDACDTDADGDDSNDSGKGSSADADAGANADADRAALETLRATRARAAACRVEQLWGAAQHDEATERKEDQGAAAGAATASVRSMHRPPPPPTTASRMH